MQFPLKFLAHGWISEGIDAWTLTESTTTLVVDENIPDGQCCRRTGSFEIFCIDVLRALQHMEIREGVISNSCRNSKCGSTTGMD